MCRLEEHARVREETVFCPLSLSCCHVPYPPQRPLGAPSLQDTGSSGSTRMASLFWSQAKRFKHISTWWHSEIKIHLMWSSLVAYVFVFENNIKILQSHRLKYI